MPMSCWHHASRRLSAVPSRPSGPSCRYGIPSLHAGIPKCSLPATCLSSFPSRAFPFRGSSVPGALNGHLLPLRGRSYSTSTVCS